MPEETSATQPPATVPQEVLQGPEITSINPNSPTEASPPDLGSPSRQKTEGEDTSESGRVFCEFTHQYLRQYIELADQKAAFLFAVVSALSAYAVSSSFSPFANPAIWCWPPDWHHFAGKISIFLFFFSAFFCILVVLPRLWPNPQPGLIFWEDILAMPSQEKYVETACSQTSQTASCQMAKHAYTLAGVCKRKYLLLKLAMYSALLGLILISIYLWPLLGKIALLASQK